MEASFSAFRLGSLLGICALRFPPPSSAPFLNRIHKQSEREAISPSWKQTAHRGLEMRRAASRQRAASSRFDCPASHPAPS